MTDNITVSRELLRQVVNAACSPYCAQDLGKLMPAIKAAIEQTAPQTQEKSNDHKLVPLRPPESILAVVRKAYGNATAYDVGHVWHEIYTRLPDAAPVQEPCAELIDYILQADIHNRLTPRVVDIAYSAWSLGRSGKNMDDGGPCDWFNGTKPMVMTQLAKIKKDLAEEAQPRKAVKLSDSEILTALDVEYVSSAQNRELFLSDARTIEQAVWAKLGVTE